MTVYGFKTLNESTKLVSGTIHFNLETEHCIYWEQQTISETDYRKFHCVVNLYKFWQILFIINEKVRKCPRSNVFISLCFPLSDGCGSITILLWQILKSIIDIKGAHAWRNGHIMQTYWLLFKKMGVGHLQWTAVTFQPPTRTSWIYYIMEISAKSLSLEDKLRSVVKLSRLFIHNV